MTPAKLPALTVEDVQVMRAFWLVDRPRAFTESAINKLCDLAIKSLRQPDAGATPRTDAVQSYDGPGGIDEAFKHMCLHARQLERELAALSAPAGSRGCICKPYEHRPTCPMFTTAPEDSHE